eukprot:COSAG06_NODE_112_length_23474_cov_81.804458_25_plen_54_part_00
MKHSICWRFVSFRFVSFRFVSSRALDEATTGVMRTLGLCVAEVAAGEKTVFCV